MLGIEDGYFVSFFSDDEKKIREPRSIVVISDGVVTICPNKKSKDDAEWLSALAERLKKLDPKSQAYADEAIALESFWDYNGYTPNPSDFIAPEDYDGKYDDLISKWKIQ